MSAHFLFQDDRLVCERIYFDQLTIMRQLGLAHDSSSLAGRLTTLVSHPLTIGRAAASRVAQSLVIAGRRKARTPAALWTLLL
jgi:hypothetical protein